MSYYTFFYPKRGYNNARFETVYAVINVSGLNRFENGTVVKAECIDYQYGAIRNDFDFGSCVLYTSDALRHYVQINVKNKYIYCRSFR